jgi:hypothetical protein
MDDGLCLSVCDNTILAVCMYITSENGYDLWLTRGHQKLRDLWWPDDYHDSIPSHMDFSRLAPGAMIVAVSTKPITA